MYSVIHYHATPDTHRRAGVGPVIGNHVLAQLNHFNALPSFEFGHTLQARRRTLGLSAYNPSLREPFW
jgi:hypothetical protein